LENGNLKISTPKQLSGEIVWAKYFGIDEKFSYCPLNKWECPDTVLILQKIKPPWMFQGLSDFLMDWLSSSL
jgi:hypothetical protein